ncbi:MAG: hypothetical protein Q8R24_01455 [Legionellaceae bacterium]|nr:hypothetical protein [Legionellaceae bacterium]
MKNKVKNKVFNKDTEFFISVGKQGLHSFIMLGAVPVDGKPELLVRVGKTNYDEFSQDPTFRDHMRVAGKAMTQKGSLARLADERPTRKDSDEVVISYQAFDLTYTQLLDVFSLIQTIERDLANHPGVKESLEGCSFKRIPVKPERGYLDTLLRSQYIRTKDQVFYYSFSSRSLTNLELLDNELTNFDKQFPEQQMEFLSRSNLDWITTNLKHDRAQEIKEVIENSHISGYLPNTSVEQSEKYHFKFQKFNECNTLTLPPSIVDENHSEELTARSKILNNTYFLNKDNTCRSTAADIMDQALGIEGEVPRNFLTTLPYTTTLKAGSPDKESFYRLPNPAKAYPEHPHPEVLEVLFKRLQEIPKHDPKSKKTREKFDALKKEYKSLAGSNTLSAAELLTKIDDMLANQALTASRSKWHEGNIIPSSTKTTLKSLKKSVQRKVELEAPLLHRKHWFLEKFFGNHSEKSGENKKNEKENSLPKVGENANIPKKK